MRHHHTRTNCKRIKKNETNKEYYRHQFLLGCCCNPPTATPCGLQQRQQVEPGRQTRSRRPEKQGEELTWDREEQRREAKVGRL
mmetsp:Transcript_14927/g.32229  ORF Transcript_14927/g.32229 Transcript_14927/m.32229 type:complete len:84 (+) Transcript_14927:92-343(+)